MNFTRGQLLKIINCTFKKSASTYAFSTLDPEQMKRFDKISNWWAPDGPMHILYKYNYKRVDFIKNIVRLQNKKEKKQGNQNRNQQSEEVQSLLYPFRNKLILDVGCGAGFFTKSFARLGGDVTGLDPNKASYEEAIQHQQKYGEESEITTKLSYLNSTLGDYLQSNPSQRCNFDVVTSMDVIEHVENPQTFIEELVQATKPNGIVLLSTISKSLYTWFTHIIVAEYLARIVPVGTHQYQKFIAPEDLKKMMEKAGLEIVDIKELDVNWKGEFSETRGGGNYMIAGKKKEFTQ